MRCFSLLASPEGIGPAGIRIVGRWPKRSAPIKRPGTILSQMPSKAAPSNIASLSAIAVPCAKVSRLHSDRSMPDCPVVTPSHIAEIGNAPGGERGGRDVELGVV